MFQERNNIVEGLEKYRPSASVGCGKVLSMCLSPCEEFTQALTAITRYLKSIVPKIDMSITAVIKRSASSPRSYSGRDGPGYEEVFPTQIVAG